MKRQVVLLTLASVGSVVLHGGFAFALKRLGHLDRDAPSAPMQVTFEVQKQPEPTPPPPEPPPPEPKPITPPPPPNKKYATVTPKAPPPPTPEPPPPPGPKVDDTGPPSPQRIVVKLDGQIYVNPGAEGGTATGRPGGTGKGPGGGGPNDQEGSTGIGKVAITTSVKVLPRPIGDYDVSKDYPAEAKRLSIEGDVVVRLLVDEKGRVAQKKLVRGLGFGLDENALAFAGELRFEPARDENDQAVATWIPWTFHFKLPR